jgi:hypothetical protein
VIAKADLTEDQLNMYLSNPPAGKRPRLQYTGLYSTCRRDLHLASNAS